MKRRGFTLIELLVVIAIMTLLMCLLYPVLRMAREQARVTVCGSKIKQLVLGLQNYEAAQGTFPYGFQGVGAPAARGPFAGVPAMDLVGTWWFDYSQQVNHEYRDGLEVLMCPSKRQGDRLLEVDILAGNYGVNMAICKIDRYIAPYKEAFSGVSLSSAAIPRPGETLLVVDSGYSLICWWQAAQEPPVTLPPRPWIQNTCYVPGLSINDEKSLWPGQTEDAIGGRHPQKTVNVGFVDGHVNRLGADELLVEKTPDEQWDHSPLWQPRREPSVTLETSP